MHNESFTAEEIGWLLADICYAKLGKKLGEIIAKRKPTDYSLLEEICALHYEAKVVLGEEEEDE